MTGPEHYHEAERLEKVAVDLMYNATQNTYAERAQDAHILLARAQVHADLAQVAATIDSRGYGATEIRHDKQWAEVLGS